MPRRSKRERAIFVRVSNKEHAMIEEAAARSGLSLASYLRTEGLRAAQKMSSAAESLTT